MSTTASLAMTLFLGLVVASCGSSNNTPTTSGTSASPTPSPSSSSSTSTPAGCVATNKVTIQNYAFSPNCIVVPSVGANANVTFTNQDSAVHTATSDTGASLTFDSGDLNQGASFQQSFAGAPSAGTTVTGHCTYHDFMTFKVIVSPRQ